MLHTLESQKIFPIIAWVLVIGFATFTWTLTLHLKAELNNISSGVEYTELHLNQET